MKRSGSGLFMAVLLALGLVFLGLTALTALQKAEIARLEKGIQALKEELVPIRFMVLERDKGLVKARVRMYDLAGNEVDLLEMTWPGTELSFDFSVVPAAGRYLAFPRRIFTDRLAPSSGTNLFPRYDKEGFPAVFEGADFGRLGRARLTDLFQALKEDREPSGSFGSVVHDIARIAAFQPGVVYKVVARPKGGIEILED